jgi:hypothetical protein
LGRDSPLANTSCLAEMTHIAIGLQLAKGPRILCRMASLPPHSHAQGGSGRTLERAATWLSLACAAHCLLVPVAMSVLPLFGASGLGDLGPNTELLLTVLVVGSALGGVVWGYRRHGDARVVLATSAGLGAYLIGHLLEDQWYGVALAVLGGLMLAASSFVSARLSHNCEHASCEA